MKILFTGASSFTGSWFVQELSKAGHNVVTTFSHPREAYEGLRKQRVEEVIKCSDSTFSCPFGSPPFFELIASSSSWDLLCHHAADVTNYKSEDFNIYAALENNTKYLPRILDALGERGCRKVLLTGSIFEPHEGSGSDDLRGVSPYGLSKGLTFELFLFYCQLKGYKLGKFVIPNPFGPYEEPRFTTFLIKQWLEGKKALVTAPRYVRDNVPVSLLAKVYRRFAEELNNAPGVQKINPSFYAGPQGEFTQRFAQEMEPRLGISCSFTLADQKEFPEPQIRVNLDRIDIRDVDWTESDAWDELANYYKTAYALSF